VGGGGVYVKDLSTGALTLVSTAVSTKNVSLSPDGSKVAFVSNATNLDPADTDSHYDVYVRDLTTGALTLASIDDTGVKGNQDSGDPYGLTRPSLSADGTRVAFDSFATNLDPRDGDTHSDVYVKNLVTGKLKLASINDAGTKANRAAGSPSLSGDGHRVAFQTKAMNLDPADTVKDDDLYVKDLATGDLTLASTSDAGVKGDNASFLPSLSGDGTRMAFNSWATNLDPADPDTYNDIYVKDLTTGDVTLASTSDAGVKGNGYSASLSGDGTRVAFQSSAMFDPADTSRNDIYVKDLVTGDITLASTSDTGVKGNERAGYPSLSADGARVAFPTPSTNLDPADSDGFIDTYVKTLPSVATSIDVAGCSNGNSGIGSIVDIRSYDPRPLGCPVSLGGAAGNDYPDTTPILVGPNPRLVIDWASGPNSYGIAAVKAGPTPTQWRVRFTITASPGHDNPATNQYLPAADSGASKTRLQGKFDVSALDSFNCTTGVDDPLSWLSLANNGTWVAKTS
jgi:Tol biopolymer transport system component